MKLMQLFSAFALAIGVAGCSIVETPTRAAAPTLGEAELVKASDTAPLVRNYTVSQINVFIPTGLTVSEANSYYPIADIVWRGDPIGDRKAQVAAIFQTAFVEGTAGLDGEMPVVVDITLRRFHSLTERTRYSVGGVHSIRFDMTVRHGVTGAVIEPTRSIDAPLPALGGQAAIQADQRGETQKARILYHLSVLARRELTGVIPVPAT